MVSLEFRKTVAFHSVHTVLEGCYFEQIQVIVFPYNGGRAYLTGPHIGIYN